VKKRFKHELSAISFLHPTKIISAVRSFCLKVGIQLNTRNYDFTSENPISANDILNFYPVVKHISPKSSDGYNFLEVGNSFFQQGRLDSAFECLTESLAIFHQVYGPLYTDTALCYSTLAMVLYHAGDAAQALLHQKKATIINERTQGLDHFETTQAYALLGIFSHAVNNIKDGLNFIKRSIYLNDIIAGLNHSSNANTYTNLAIMLQDLGKYDEALQFLEEALRLFESTTGSESMQVAATCHSIAMCLSFVDNFKEALRYEKKNLETLKKLVGENDPRTTEANVWLKQFAAKSLQVYNEEKKLQQALTNLTEEKFEKLKQTALREGKKLNIFPIPQAANTPASNSTLRAKPRKFPGQRVSIAQAAANAISSSNTPISELLKFINNPNAKPASSTNGTNGSPTDETQKKKKKKKKKNNLTQQNTSNNYATQNTNAAPNTNTSSNTATSTQHTPTPITNTPNTTANASSTSTQNTPPTPITNTPTSANTQG